MGDFFLLNPRYERYELGVYPLEFQAVYGDVHARLGSAVGRAILFSVLMTVVIKMGALEGKRQIFTADVADQLIRIVLIGTFALAVGAEIVALFHTLQANKRYILLRKQGILLKGNLKSIHFRETKTYTFEKLTFKRKERRGTYYIDVVYTFTTTNQRILSGKQTVIREDLRDKPLPPVGTPVRVLYADDANYMML